MLTHPTSNSWFPLAHYHGISVMVDLPAACETLRQISLVMKEKPIDLYTLHDRLCGGETCFIMRATDAIQHIFSDLYAVPPAIRSGYFKLKVLELLLFLDSAELPQLRENRAYITRTQADTIRAIRTYLVEHLERHITLPELSAQFGIPLTNMKQNFKTVYGDTIGTYIQSYPMQKAMWLIQETDQSIAAVLPLRDKWAIKTQASFLRCSGRFPVSAPRNIEKFPVRLERNPSFQSRNRADFMLSSFKKSELAMATLIF